MKWAKQCRNKIKKLKYKYRKIKDKHSKTGDGRSNWKFLKVLHNVLMDKPTTCSAIVVSSSVEDNCRNYCESDGKSTSQDVSVQDPTAIPSLEYLSYKKETCVKR